jgi:hypothetical protein
MGPVLLARLPGGPLAPKRPFCLNGALHLMGSTRALRRLGIAALVRETLLECEQVALVMAASLDSGCAGPSIILRPGFRLARARGS